MATGPGTRTIRIITAAAAAVATGLVSPTGADRVAADSLSAADATELRAAIQSLNVGEDGSPDVITLTNPGPYLLDCGTNENSNANGDLDIFTDDDVTITYAGAGRATIAVDQTTPCTNERVIDFRGTGTLRLEHIEIRDGDLSTAGGYGTGDGGGIYVLSTGTLELDDVVVEGNRAGDAAMTGTNVGGRGGGIMIREGSAAITNSIIRDNRAGDGRPATDSGNGGSGGIGGGIGTYNAQAITLQDTLVQANRAGDGGPASATFGAGSGGSGGGIGMAGTGTLTITGGSIGGPLEADGNQAGHGGAVGAGGNGGYGAPGGGIAGSFTDATTITGAEIAYNRAGNGTAEDGQSNAGLGGRGGGIYSGGPLTLTNTHVHHNAAGDGASLGGAAPGTGGDGGGIGSFGGFAVLSITDSLIEFNTAGAGGSNTNGVGASGGAGGGVQYGGAEVTILRTTIRNNSAGTGGDSSDDFSGNGGSGGGVRISGYTTTDPVATITDSSILDNAAGSPGTGVSTANPGNGGGIYTNDGTLLIDRSLVAGNGNARFGGGAYFSNDITMRNSTWHANEALADGGGFYGTAGTRTLEAVTFTGNAASLGGSIFEAISGDKVFISRSVLAEPASNSNCGGSGDVVDQGDNLEQHPTGVGTCGLAPVVDTDLGFGPLQDNGGETLTRLPAQDSPLVDAIAIGDCVETTDQRTTPRPVNGGCDIGAVELAATVQAVADSASGIADELVVDVLSNDVVADVPLDPGTVVVSVPPVHGTTGVDLVTGAVTYTPTGDFEGTDSFVYRVCVLGGDPVDGDQRCAQATVDVDITRIDTTPDAFAFVDVTGVGVGSTQTSNAVVIAGVNQAAPVTVAGGTWSKNGGGFTSAAGTVVAGDSVRVRHTAAAAPSTSVDTTLTVGGVSDTFTSTTVDPDPDPDPEPEPEPEVPEGATVFVPLDPERLFDTRFGTGGVPVGTVAANSTLDVQVGGELGVPEDAAAVVINLTVTEPQAAGFITGFPTGSAQPLASTLNVTAPGQTRPNLAVIPLGDDGMISIYSWMTTHVLGDVAGYYAAAAAPASAGRLVPLAPTRIFDSRPGEPANGPKGFVPADTAVSVQIAGEGGVPAEASAVVLNVTATQSAGPNFVTVWPTGLPMPLASSLNLGTGETAANLVMVPLGDDGRVDFYTLAGTHLLADVTGYVTGDTAPADTAGMFVPLDPARVFDTRPAEPANGPKGYVAAGETITTQFGGVVDVPADAAAVAMNLTATEAPTGHITVYPHGEAEPLASTLNLLGASDTRANAAVLPVGDDGQIDVFTFSGAHLLADIAGYYL